MISYYDGQITDLLGPNFKQDIEVQALSFAIREGTRMLQKYAQNAVVYSGIDNLPGEVLDLLATELRTQYYDTSYSLAVKRALIKNTNRWHQIAGTKAAVVELAKNIFGECELYEWDEYDGKPYTFRIITNAPASSDDIETFTTLLANVKNQRSHLEAVAIHKTIDTRGGHSAAVVSVTAKPQPVRCTQ